MAKCEEIKPKSRHYALRMLNVRDEKARLWFVRTDKMCADALTKPVSGKQRKLLLGKSSNTPIEKVKKSNRFEDLHECVHSN